MMLSDLTFTSKDKQMASRIELSWDVNEADHQAILKPLRAYNVANGGAPAHENFALLLRDSASNEVIGGLHGAIAYQWMHIEHLFVPEQVRGQGTGSQLMKMAEDVARQKACIGIWLDTSSFQAPHFYQKLGFSEFGKITDYPPGHALHFFQKRLN